MLHRPGQAPELWFPAGDLDTAALPTGALQDFAAGQDPVAEALAGSRSLAPDAVDRWFIEDEPVYAHVRDPYHRVDVLASHRHVLVEHAGTIVADTTRPGASCCRRCSG